MIERVSIEQHTFRTPGLFRDRRGILVAKRTLILFLSLDRAVAFLCACGEQGLLGELLSSLELHRVQNQSRSHEIALLLEVRSGRELDQLCGLARLGNARTYIGGRKHFVPFRDARGPAGYDTTSLDECDDDIVLYGARQNERLRWGRRLALADLVHQLELRKTVEQPVSVVEEALLWIPAGIIDQVRRYLLDRAVETEIAVAEVKSDSILDDGPMTANLLRLFAAPGWVVQLFADLPEVRVFTPASTRCYIERGFTHPLPLNLMEERLEDGVHLFEGASSRHPHGRTVQISPVPAFARLHASVALRSDETPPIQAHPASKVASLSIPLRATPSTSQGLAVATIVPVAQREWLAKLMYLMPKSALENLQVALSDAWIFVYDPSGLSRLPLGQHFVAHIPDLLIPSGYKLQPAVSEEVLREALPLLGRHLVFVGPGPRTLYVPKDSFASLARSALADLAGSLISANRPHYETRDLVFVDYDG